MASTNLLEATVQAVDVPTTNKPPTPKMQYTRLGRSGLKISRLVLGCMGIGSPSTSTGSAWVTPASEALPILKYAYDQGINTWDTADFYSLGTSEEIIGQAIREYKIPREKLVLLTKCYFGVSEELLVDGKVDLLSAIVNDGMMVNRVGLSRKHILDAVDASVARYVSNFLLREDENELLTM
jgi:aryl-alcohol dehydrogenase-like predicted oxidoreductase